MEGHVSCLTRRCDACLAPVILANLDGENNWIEDWYYRRSMPEILHNKHNIGLRATFNTGNTSFQAPVLRRLRFNSNLGISEDGTSATGS